MSSSAKIKQSPKLPAEKRRQQLMKSAQRLFVRKGYRSTTTEEIARRAGLTKGALYFHFKSKEDLFFALVKSISEAHDEALEAAIHKGMSPAEFFKALTSAHLSHNMPDYSDVVDIWVQAMRIPRLKRFLAQRISQYVDVYVDLVDPAFARNKPAMRDLGVFTMALFDGLSVFRLIEPSLVDMDRQAKLFESFFEHATDKNKRKGKR